MSYILDALRRAEAERERERGTVPNVHARSMPSAEAPARDRRQPPAGLLLFGVGALLLALVLALLLAWLLWRGPARAPASPAPVELAAQPSPEPAPPALPPAPVVQIVPVPVPAPAAAAVPTPAPAAQPARRAQLPAESAGAAAAPEPEQDSPLTRPLPLAQLPLDLRQSLPPLAVGGSVYSDDAAARFVMINGQVLREGESPAAGVSIERIDPKAVILRWRGLRIEVPL